MKTFKEILAWQFAYKLTLEIYKITNGFPRSEEFGLKSQMRRVGVSIVSNIAEGFKRSGLKDRLHFYKIAECSLEEIKCQSMLSRDLGYLKDDIHKSLCKIEDETGRILRGWIKAQR